MPKAKVTTPYQNAWSACEPVKLPTSAGSTGMIRPIEIMSISAVAMMKGIAAARPRRAAKSLKRDCVTGIGAGAGSGKRILNEATVPLACRASSPAACGYGPQPPPECRFCPPDKLGRTGIGAGGSGEGLRRADARRPETAGSARSPQPLPAEMRYPGRRPGRCNRKLPRRFPAERLREAGRSLPAILRQHLLQRYRLDLASAVGGEAVLGLLCPELVDIRIGLVEACEDIV